MKEILQPEFEPRAEFEELLERRRIDLAGKIDVYSVMEVVKKIREMIKGEEKSLVLAINSTGGEARILQYLEKVISETGARVYTFVEEKAESAGAFALLLGEKIYAAPFARIVFHEARPVQEGEAPEKSRIWLERQRTRLTNYWAEKLAQKTKRTQEETLGVIRGKQQMTAQEAKEFGLIDEIFEGKGVKKMPGVPKEVPR